MIRFDSGTEQVPTFARAAQGRWRSLLCGGLLAAGMLLVQACQTTSSSSSSSSQMPSSSPPPTSSSSSSSPGSSSSPSQQPPSSSSSSSSSQPQPPPPVPGPSGAPDAQTTTPEPGSQSSQSESSASAAAGEPSELEVLEPEEATTSSDSDSDSDSEAASGGAEAGGEQSDASAGSTAAAGDASAAGGAAGSESAEQSGGDSGAAGAASTAGIPTSELDQELNSSLEGFEGDMQERMIVIASNRPPAELEGDEAAPSGGDESADEQGETGNGAGTPGLVRVDDPSQLPPAASEPGSGRTATSGTIQEDGGMPGAASGREGSNRDAMVSSRVPSDIGDGSDDDVVARQIREAAMNEADPVLREKLWEEYRNYKKAIR